MSHTPEIALHIQPPLDGAQIIDLASERGCTPPDLDELAQAREMASRRMAHEVAPMETYLMVRELQPSAVLVFRELGVVTGVISSLFLRPQALPELVAARFNGVRPNPALLTREGERPGLVYSWGMAACSRAAAAAILGVGAEVTGRLFPRITAFTRAVTDDGRRVAARNGYRPVTPDNQEWLVRTPASMELAA